MVDHVESFREINRHGQCAVRWQGLVETRCHRVCEGKESCSSVVSLSEAVLCGGDGEGICEFREEKAFEHFNGGA